MDWCADKDGPLHASEPGSHPDHTDDIPSTGSREAGLSVRQVIAETQHNEAEIVPAPRELLEQLGEQYINNLETIPVTPEAPWDEAGEQLLRHWMDEAKTASYNHQRSGYILKRRYKLIKFGTILMAVIVFLFTSLFDCDAGGWQRVVQIVASALNMLVVQLASFLSYGAKFQLHFEYEAHYSKYAIDIEELLVTDIDFRSPKDKVLTEFRERKKQLVAAPELV